MSNRLNFLYSFLEEGNPVFDIACDHGLLGIKALQSFKFPHVTFIDQSKNVIRKLNKTIFDLGINNHFETICEKAQSLSYPNPGNIVIAGVGSMTVIQILRHLMKEEGFKQSKIILAPNNITYPLRVFLKENFLNTSKEVLIEDGNILFEILVLDKKSDHSINLFGKNLESKSDITLFRHYKGLLEYHKWKYLRKNEDNCYLDLHNFLKEKFKIP